MPIVRKRYGSPDATPFARPWPPPRPLATPATRAAAPADPFTKLLQLLRPATAPTATRARVPTLAPALGTYRRPPIGGAS